MLKILFKYGTIILMTVCNFCYAQPSNSRQEIDRAVAAENYNRANALLQTAMDAYYAKGRADSLAGYISYVGSITLVQSNTATAVENVQHWIKKIKGLSPPSAVLIQAYLDAGEFYGSIGQNSLGYKANQEALKIALSTKNSNYNQLGQIENNLATYAQRMADINLSLSHRRAAQRYLLSDNQPDVETLYIAYQGMGGSMWYASKMDSALLYYNKALQLLQKMPPTPINQYYRPAILQNNLSGLYQLQGQTTEAINALKAAIVNIKKFIADKEPSSKKASAKAFQFEITDNLAGIYKELGDLKKAKELLEYSYQQKQQSLEPEDPGIFISQILLGQLYFAMKDFDKALQFLNSGLHNIAAAEGDYLFWQADACNTLSLLFNEKKNVKQAALYYEKADSLYQESLQGEYDNIYLDFLANAALFYAENNAPETAMAKANKAYSYVAKTQGAQTLLAFHQLLNLAEVNLRLNNYKKALSYCISGLHVVNSNIQSSNNLLDSIRMELKKPRAILLKTKAEYELLPQKNAGNLTALLNQLNAALALLERRKTVLSNAEDIGLMMADHADLIEFAKAITLDLYKITNNENYIGRIMGLHESGLYNRIRSRLDKNDSIQFAHLPASVQAKEKKLKNATAAVLKGPAPHGVKLQLYVQAIDEWNKFQEEIRLAYPRYYAMRYASLFTFSDEIQKSIPANTTLIRYFFIEKDLYALVADNKQKQVFALQKGDLEQQLSILTRYSMDAAKTAGILQALYRQLWEPLAKAVRHKKIMIVPDGILFNLNFEILTPQKITGFKELAAKSLLAKYTISYHYSLFLLGQKNNAQLSENAIVFAPGFSDQAKQRYRSLLKDSFEMDRGYLSLLPQPFTVSLAHKTQQLFGGNVFINEQSTENSFRAHAGNHKIIHIGTHAESNNDYPEFSRLIFAKNTAEPEEDNSLYVDEIYNCNLTSNLTVLTACESGKPGYQDGAGMISLAHAFNYAGSQSMLTALWKIDEQASAILIEQFYKNLLQGMPKDEALRQAKLMYLQQAEGRMQAPQYWAGLVLIGDAEPVSIKRSVQSGWYIISFAVLLTAIIFIVVQRRIKTVRSH